jgi:Carboxypeptidase regulatory-like domain
MRWSAVNRNFILASIVLMLMTVATWAQTGTTSLRGTVTDKSGAAITGAQVTLLSQEQGQERAAQTKNGGEYEFLLLPPGKYTLTAEAGGFRKFTRRDIDLLISNPTTIDIGLELGSSTESIEVSAQAVTLNTTDSSLGIAFNENQVKELPLEGRNVPDLLSLQPGVVYTGHSSDVNDKTYDTRSGSVNGARSDQSNITVDGIPVNTHGGYAFQSVLPVTLDSVEEFRVTTTNYNADQGGTSGAQVALVSKSGSNNFHGSAYEYNRNTATSANEWFVKQGELNAGEPNTPPKLIRNIFGASLGGPIKKDRLFLFMNFEAARRVEETAETQQVPSLALRDGIIQYACAAGSNCPGMNVTGISGATYSVPQGFYALDHTQIQGLDPLSIGPSAVMLQYLNSFPVPNNFTTGDGFNYQGFSWRAPIRDTQNVYIAKMDYNLTRDGKQRVSVSGALQNDVNPQGPFLPGQAPSNSLVNYNKGIIVNLTSVITSNIINNFRYGFVRQSFGDIGNTNQPVVTIRGLNDQTGAITYTNEFQRPVHNFFDDVSWMRGKHNWQFGTAISILRSPNSNFLNAFSGASTNASWLDTAGLAVKPGSPFDPSSPANAAKGYPAVDPGFANSYDYPLLAMLGMVTEVDAQYNFDKTGTPLSQGTPVVRRYGIDSYEFYLQDVWKVKPNFTLTLGLRYSLFSPPWETNGLEVVPSLNLSQWFNQRAENQLNGIGSYADPAIQFQLGGAANGKPGYYNWDYKNFAPRLAFAWSPKYAGGLLNALFGDGKSSIRGGASMVYDRAGEALVNNFDASGGAFGLSTTLPNPAATQSVASAPRITSLNTIPTLDNNGNAIFEPPPPAGFPVTYPAIEAITSGLDQNIKTPYSYTFDLSFSRELPSNFQIEVAYVGRLSRRLLTPDDLAMPLDLHDKASGLDYFQAVTALAKVYRSGVTDENFTPSMVSPAVAQYWADIIPTPVAGSAYGIGPNGVNGGCFNSATPPTSTLSPLVAAFDLFCSGSRNETTPLQLFDAVGITDLNGGPGYLPLGKANTFFNPQFSSLYAWRSMGFANYNAMEVTLRHPASHGIQFDFNYTFSKSIDLSSDAERIGLHSGLGGQIINAWSPYQLRSVSDFDATHQFNANWVLDFPFGRGRRFAPDASKALNAFIGGWQLSGLWRLTSGFPVNVSNGAQWPTNWELGGQALLTGPVQTGVFKNATPGAVSVFSNGLDAINSFTNPFPGQSGGRNQIRGDGYFGIDMGLSKRWVMPWSEKHSLQFRAEVFNLTNSVRFNIQTGSLFLDTSSTFGNYTGTLSNARVMQFALRYDF